MRTILSKKEKIDFFSYNPRLVFKYTVSRGRETYGYNICSLFVNDEKVSSCNGGGYDMKGTSFANWVKDTFNNQLKKLNTKEFYGLAFWKVTGKNERYRNYVHYKEGCTISLNGACGFSSIEDILNKIGFMLEYVGETNNTTSYIMRPSTFDKNGRRKFL